jgi:hypothetical protein
VITTPMRWLWTGLVLLLVGWLAYAASPFVALYRLSQAVEERDASALRERINFRAVTLSLARQVTADYLARTGHGHAITEGERQIVTGTVASIADPLVAELVNSETVLDLIAQGWPKALAEAGLEPGTDAPPAFRADDLGTLLKLAASSETRGFRALVVAYPPHAARDSQFRLRLRIHRWTWRVTGLDLSASLRHRLADELARRVERYRRS